MKYDDVTNLIHKLKVNVDRADDYLNSCPVDLRDAISDNGYLNPHMFNFDLLLSELISDENLLEDVNSFLWDFKEGKTITLSGNMISTELAFFKYLKSEYEEIFVD